MKTERYSLRHVKQRLQERYGLPITKEDYNKLKAKIKTLTPDVMEDDSAEKQGIFTLPFKGKNVTFVYSYTLDRIKTVLPPRIT